MKDKESTKMDEITYWLNLWSRVIILIAIVAICITSYNINITNNISDLISKGADPISVRCALDTSSTAVCTTNIFVKSK